MLLSYRTKGLFIFEFVIRYKAFMKGKLMNKYGHVTVTKRLTPNLKKRHDFALRLGSIMPDLLIFRICSALHRRLLYIST